jgi:hypothetical protein
MRTDDLIAELAGRPWPATRPGVRLAFAMAVGWTIALVALVLMLGMPLAAVDATGTTPFALKLGYTSALAIITGTLAVATGKPGRRLGPPSLLIALPVALIAIAAMLELASTPATGWTGLMFGSTFRTCMVAITVASLPVFAAVIWSFRALAPTRLALAGFVAGLSAGAAGAVAYALYCPETTASFLLVSYTPGMLIPALIGAALGPHLLRW